MRATRCLPAAPCLGLAMALVTAPGAFAAEPRSASLGLRLPVHLEVKRRVEEEPVTGAVPEDEPASVSTPAPPSRKDALATARRAHELARIGRVVNGAGGAAGFVILYAGSLIHLGCALDDACVKPDADILMGTGLALTSLSMGVGGGLMHGGGMSTAMWLDRAGGDANFRLAASGLALNTAALACLGGATVFAVTSDDLWDAVAVAGLTTGGAVFWLASTAVGTVQIRKNRRWLEGMPARPTVRVAPAVDPLSRTIGLVGVW